MSRLAESALSWWEEAGVDTLVGETPRDWLAAPKPAASKPAEPKQAPAPEEALPADLPAFQAWLATTGSLPFAAPGITRVPPAGAATSGVMAISDVPSAEDVAAGSLFSGEQGALLDRMLNAIGLSRETVYLAPFSPIAPPGGRIARTGVDRLAGLMRHHIGLVSPRALLIFGDSCARALLGISMAQARGAWHEVETPAGSVRALVTLRPQELQVQPKLKALAWADLQMLKERLTA